MVIEVLEEIADALNSLPPNEVAEAWAYEVAGSRGSINKGAIYSIYTSTQQEPRKTAITSRFTYLTSQEGALELAKIANFRENPSE